MNTKIFNRTRYLTHQDLTLNQTQNFFVFFLIFVTCFIFSDKTDCLKNAQRFVHSHPESAESWAMLTSACYAKTILSR